MWQHRFYDFNVWSERKRVEKLRYMHRNPVKRGLVAAPDLWRWSSFRSYAYREAGPVKVLDRPVLKKQDRAASQIPLLAKAREVGHPWFSVLKAWHEKRATRPTDRTVVPIWEEIVAVSLHYSSNEHCR